MTTAPKYIQAQGELNSRNGQGSASSTNMSTGPNESEGQPNLRQVCGNFVKQYKQLPSDFLRVPASYYQMQLQQQQQQQIETITRGGPLSAHSGGPLVDMIDISVVEAQLVKNYGLLRMDLYCKIRVGHMVCETPTCPNGAKNPKWDGVYQFSLKPGIDSFHFEIYDEKQFSLDEKIAWLHEPIPPEVFQGITVERWFPLTGRSGVNKEGSVLLVVSHKRVPMRASNFGRSDILHQQHIHHGDPNMPPMAVFLPHQALPNQPRVIGGTGASAAVPVDPIYIQAAPQQSPSSQVNIESMNTSSNNATQQQQQQQRHTSSSNQPNTAISNSETTTRAADHRQASDEDISQLSEMFPSIDKSIIKAILENNNLDKESAISTLLAMS